MSDVQTRLLSGFRYGFFIAVLACLMVFQPIITFAAPYAAFVIDARNGKVLHSRNADTRLHPASLTKMMTLYVTFEAIKNGEISLETVIKISRNAASEPPSKLGLKTGQRIKLRYLIRATAVKSANDAATALGEAISGSEAAFARRMNRTALALGMTRTTFKNMNGLTQSGHLSTARDMTTLGRHLFFDYPQYYNLFSRVTTNAGVREVSNTNRRLLAAYRGADGIKTGYTRAAGFNLVASAKRGNERIIATVFGGRSTATRNARVAELLDMGFKRAPSRTRIRKPALPNYTSPPPSAAPAQTPDAPAASVASTDPRAAGKILRVSGAVQKSVRPPQRPAPTAPPEELLLAMHSNIKNAVSQAQETAPEPVLAQAEVATTPLPAVTAPTVTAAPPARPANIVLASVTPEQPVGNEQPITVSRVSSSGGSHWGINIGRYESQRQAERILLQTALREMSTLDGSLRKVVRRSTGFDATFVGMSKETAALACQRLQARNITCMPLGPT